MNRPSITIGRIYGISVGFDYSWLLIFILVTWSLASDYFPAEYKQWSPAIYWLVGGIASVLFFGSVFLHELVHSLVAERFDVHVRRIHLYIFGGVSELDSEPPTARSEFWITITGPLTNLLLAGLFYLLSLVLAPVAPAQAAAKYLAYINLILGGFNLLPGYPLDGGSVLMAIVWGITHKRQWGIFAAAAMGNFLAYVLIVFGAIQAVSGGLMSGLWTAFIGWFMLNASGNAVRRERLKELLAGHRVAEAMSKNYAFVYPDTSLQSLVDEHILGSSERFLLVKEDDQVMGMLTMHAMQHIPREEWAAKTVAEVMIPVSRLITTQPSTEIYEAMQAMDRDGVNQLPVIEDGQIQGILTREDMISYLRRLQNAQTRFRPIA